jgi:hypothetical protein
MDTHQKVICKSHPRLSTRSASTPAGRKASAEPALLMVNRRPTSAGDRSMATATAGTISQIAVGAQSLAKWPMEKGNKSPTPMGRGSSQGAVVLVDAIALLVTLQRGWITPQCKNQKLAKTRYFIAFNKLNSIIGKGGLHFSFWPQATVPRAHLLSPLYAAKADIQMPCTRIAPSVHPFYSSAITKIRMDEQLALPQ